MSSTTIAGTFLPPGAAECGGEWEKNDEPWFSAVVSKPQ
jgi:hypothetical protein